MTEKELNRKASHFGLHKLDWPKESQDNLCFILKRERKPFAVLRAICTYFEAELVQKRKKALEDIEAAIISMNQGAGEAFFTLILNDGDANEWHFMLTEMWEY